MRILELVSSLAIVKAPGGHVSLLQNLLFLICKRDVVKTTEHFSVQQFLLSF